MTRRALRTVVLAVAVGLLLAASIMAFVFVMMEPVP